MASPLRVVQLLDGREERVHVDVQDGTSSPWWPRGAEVVAVALTHGRMIAGRDPGVRSKAPRDGSGPSTAGGQVRIGAHVHVAGGLLEAVKRARESGCEATQLFVKNPRR